jgi:hypothetical protein
VDAVTHKALASAVKVIARADDSSGIIGDACRRLLDLHPKAAAAAQVPAGRLVDWMITFQFEGDVDYFELDPAADAPALGETGLRTYRARLAQIQQRLGPRPTESDRWTSPHSHDWFTLDWNDQRLAVHGCRTPPRPSRRSARSTSPSTGPSKQPRPTGATRP